MVLIGLFLFTTDEHVQTFKKEMDEGEKKTVPLSGYFYSTLNVWSCDAAIHQKLRFYALHWISGPSPFQYQFLQLSNWCAPLSLRKC